METNLGASPRPSACFLIILIIFENKVGVVVVVGLRPVGFAKFDFNFNIANNFSCVVIWLRQS